MIQQVEESVRVMFLVIFFLSEGKLNLFLICVFVDGRLFILLVVSWGKQLVIVQLFQLLKLNIFLMIWVCMVVFYQFFFIFILFFRDREVISAISLYWQSGLWIKFLLTVMFWISYIEIVQVDGVQFIFNDQLGFGLLFFMLLQWQKVLGLLYFV